METKWTCRECLKDYESSATLGATHTFLDGADIKFEFVCRPCMYSHEEAEASQDLWDAEHTVLAALGLRDAESP